MIMRCNIKGYNSALGSDKKRIRNTFKNELSLFDVRSTNVEYRSDDDIVSCFCTMNVPDTNPITVFYSARGLESSTQGAIRMLKHQLLILNKGKTKQD